MICWIFMNPNVSFIDMFSQHTNLPFAPPKPNGVQDPGVHKSHPFSCEGPWACQANQHLETDRNCGFFENIQKCIDWIMNSSLYIYIYISWHIYHRDLVKMNIICRKPVTMGIALKGKITWYLLVAPRLIHVFLVCSFAKKTTIW